MKAHLGQAVLRGALEYFGRRRGRNLRAFIDVLADLPDGLSTLSAGPKIAAGLAETLTATMVNDPLFGGAGTPSIPASC